MDHLSAAENFPGGCTIKFLKVFVDKQKYINMKKNKHFLKRAVYTLAVSCCLVSCNYLDVIPPATADYEDTMKDANLVRDFLYTCYGGVVRSEPFYFKAFERGNDEDAFPRTYGYFNQRIQWATVSPAIGNVINNCKWDYNIWNPSYNFLGYTHEFLDQIDKQNPANLTEEMRDLYKHEAYFLEAYYQFRVLQAFGPMAIIPTKVDPNILTDELPGRYHFDYCVDYLVDKLDQAAEGLPAVRETNELGRATSTICKALKARILLYAASPLWNGSFPTPTWQNTNFETPGYGKELVSTTYDEAKWDRALTACQEALSAAEAAGYRLFDVNTANSIAERQKVDLSFIPGREEDTPENIAFKERVRMFQYLSAANEGDGNNEIIWGVRISNETNNGGEEVTIKTPSFCVKLDNGSLYGGNASEAPTLYTVQHFYTENGKLPAKDPLFFSEDQWYTRFFEGMTNTDNESMPDKETVKYDIIKRNAIREARFYAWIVFDGSMYSPKLYNGTDPLWINFKNTNTNGYNTKRSRYYVGTGYLSKKFIDPNMTWYSSKTKKWTATRRPLIRMAELYLNLAECYAMKGNTSEALKNLNIIRKRAGLPDVTEADFADMSLIDWIRNERFVELYEEGHRYYDLRRWTIAPERLKAGSFYGLNGLKVNPSFEEFNKPVQIDQPFQWEDRSYLLPVWQGGGLEELYSNPQMIQAPGY